MSENRTVSLLADRYASAQMRAIFAPESKIISERKLWIAVMRAQSKLGHPISDVVIADYEKVIKNSMNFEENNQEREFPSVQDHST